MRSFFLDLDCGEKKDYPSQEAAVGALEEFLAETCLPEPILVNSGNGVHVYWPLDNPVSREEWEPVANKLKRVCRRLGLRADPVRTSDAASILRIPATHNHKSSVPKEVVVVDEEVTEITLLKRSAVRLRQTKRIRQTRVIRLVRQMHLLHTEAIKNIYSRLSCTRLWMVSDVVS